MIPACVSSSVVPALGTITSVVQDETSAIISGTFPTAFNPFGSPPILTVRSSSDDSTWTVRGTQNGTLTGGGFSISVPYIAANEYYQVSQVLSGVQGDWSSSLRFTATLATEPIAAPVSVTIDEVSRPTADLYRINFTVNQSGALSGYSPNGVRVVIGYGPSVESFSYEEFVAGSISSGDTAYQIDIVSGLLASSAFQVTVYNSLGGYESAGTASAIDTSYVPQDSIVEYFATTDPIVVPAWATNVDYWLVGGGGGGGRGKVEAVTDENDSIFWVGIQGNAGQLISGNLTLPIADFNVVIGAGGIGSLRIVSEIATAGGPSGLRTGTTVLHLALGGTAGGNDALVQGPVQPAAGSASASLLVDATLFLGMPGSAPRTDALFPLAENTDDMDSPRVTGGAGGGYAFRTSGMTSGEVESFSGGNGGAGYLKLRFRNY